MQTKPALVIALSVLLSVWTVCATYLYRLRENKPTDQTDRYQIKEYNQGKIVGLALLDKKIGRVWLLTEIIDEKGKRVRDDFREAAVSELWDTEDTIPDDGSSPFQDSAATLDQSQGVNTPPSCHRGRYAGIPYSSGWGSPDEKARGEDREAPEVELTTVGSPRLGEIMDGHG